MHENFCAGLDKIAKECQQQSHHTDVSDWHY